VFTVAQFGVLCFPGQDASDGKGRPRIRLQDRRLYAGACRGRRTEADRCSALAV